MNINWRELKQKVNALSLRERKLTAAVSAMVLSTVIGNLILSPLFNLILDTKKQNHHYEVQIHSASNSIDAVKLRAKEDINKPYINRRSELLKSVQAQENEINDLTAALIKPERMNEVLKGLLSKNKMEVMALENKPAKSIKLNEDESDQQALYEHEISIALDGDYLSALTFIGDIENQEWQVYWDTLTFQILEYPVGRLQMSVHTISTSDKVLGL